MTHRLTPERDAEILRLREIVRLLGIGSPAERLAYCEKYQLVGNNGVDSLWRQSIADHTLAATPPPDLKRVIERLVGALKAYDNGRGTSWADHGGKLAGTTLAECRDALKEIGVDV